MLEAESTPLGLDNLLRASKYKQHKFLSFNDQI